MSQPAQLDAREGEPAIRPLWRHLALALATALLLALAHPQPGWWPLAHVGLVPLALLATRAQSWRRLAWTTFLASLIWWHHMISWLIPVTGGGYSALAAYMAVYWVLFVLAFRVLDRRLRWPAAITLPLAWVSLEYIRGIFLSGGFGWFALGHVQAPYLPGDSPSRLIQVADLFGEWTVSFIVAMTNGALLDALRLFSRCRRATREGEASAETQVTEGATHGARLDKSLALPPLASVAVWLVTIIAAMAYGQYRLTTMPAFTSESNATVITVAVVQTNITQNNKMHPTPQQQEKDWRRTIELTRQAAAATPKPRIIVWPETISPVPLNPEMLHVYRSLNDERGDRYLRFHNDISNLARELNVHLLVGSVSMRADDWKSNSIMHYLPDGRQDTAIYDKHALVPFGEYIPWVKHWPWAKRQFMKYLSPYGPDNDYSLVPGDEATVFEVSENGTKLRITTPICFEDAIARASLRLAYDKNGKRCDLMLNATNDGWYPGLDQGFQQFQMAVFRCVENRVPMARSVNTGISGFIDSSGRVGPFVVTDGRMQEVDGVAIADMVIDRRETLFGKWGQTPIVLMTVFTALLVLGAGFKLKQRAGAPGACG